MQQDHKQSTSNAWDNNDRGDIRVSTGKMALAKSIKMYLTIFVATTCIYMVLYQYHISRQPMTSPEVIKNKDITAESAAGNGRSQSSISANPSPSSSSSVLSSSSSLVKRYNLFLWSPMSLLATQKQSSSSTGARAQQSPSSPAPAASLSSRSLRSSSFNASSSSLNASSSSLSTQQKLIVANIVPENTEQRSNSTRTTTTTTNPSTTAAMNKSLSNQEPSRLLSNTTTTSTTKATLSPTATRTTTTTRYTRKLEARNPFRPVIEPPPLYIITPTYRRPEQLAELTRLGYTLKHVVNLLWLVIEDANKTNELVTQTLNRIGVPYEYLVAPMPEEYKKTKKAKPRGVSNRNRGLEWLRRNATDGVFYFADDDNTYDISIFEQMRYTKKVSMWPVGLVTKFGVSSPIIRHGKIDGYYDGWLGGRRYPVDMAGFAVSVKFLHERPDAKMPFKPGYEEDGFLKSLAPLNNTEIELLASECTEVLTWHTQTKKNAPADVLNMTKYRGTNLVEINKVLVRP